MHQEQKKKKKHTVFFHLLLVIFIMVKTHAKVNSFYTFEKDTIFQL